MLDMDGTILDLAFDNYIWKELVPRRYALENDLPYEDAREAHDVEVRSGAGRPRVVLP